jgi:hypothetical protein
MITQDNFWNGFIIVFAIISLSWFIQIIQEGIIHLVKLMIRKFLNMLFSRNIVYPALQLDSYQYAQYLFKINADGIIDFVKFSSLAVPEIFTKYKASNKNAETYYDNVKNKFIKSTNLDMLFNLTYDSSLTQEQANAEKFKNNIHLLEFSCFLFPIILIALGSANGNLWLFVYLLPIIVWILIALYFHKKMKIRYAYYLIWAYTDAFKLGDWANISDREAV